MRLARNYKPLREYRESQYSSPEDQSTLMSHLLALIFCKLIDQVGQPEFLDEVDNKLIILSSLRAHYRGRRVRTTALTKVLVYGDIAS